MTATGRLRVDGEETGGPLAPCVVAEFRAQVRRAGAAYRREGLPWRGVDDPYAVYVSEAMLQQTQVARVLDYWPRFLRRFPTVGALAQAPTADVLEAWQGLGYNRRGLAMKRAATECVERFGGQMPRAAEDLQSLPGIGPATAAGIVAFAYQEPSIYIETNVRTVFIERFFADAQEPVSDKVLAPLVAQTLDRADPRGWYYDLLDWGAHLKQVRPNPSRKSKHYHRQSAFEGSRRQKRAFILRAVLDEPGATAADVRRSLDGFEREHGRGPVDGPLVDELIAELVSEGFFKKEADGRLVP